MVFKLVCFLLITGTNNLGVQINESYGPMECLRYLSKSAYLYKMKETYIWYYSFAFHLIIETIILFLFMSNIETVKHTIIQH